MTKSSSTTNEGSPLLGPEEGRVPTKGNSSTTSKPWGRSNTDTERTIDIYTSTGSYYKSTEFSSRSSDLFDSINESCSYNNNNDYENIQHGDNDDEDHDGGKSIGMIGSLSIAVNSLAGPAILQLPFQYQHSGLIPTTLCLIGVAVLSSYVCLHMANTVSKMPKNANFDKPVEFSDPFKIFWNMKAYKVTQILFFLTAICLNVAAIVDTAEVVDSVFGLQGTAYGISFDHGFEIKSWNVLESTHENRVASVNWNKYLNTTTASTNTTTNTSTFFNPKNITDLTNNTDFVIPERVSRMIAARTCTRSEVKLGLCEPFNDTQEYGHTLLTLGYLITAAVFLPICLKDLKENTAWQIFGFGILVTLSTYFCLCFASVIKFKTIFEFHRVSLWGNTWGDMLGVIMFNFALVLAIPAWLHEKQQNVSVHRTVVQSTVISTSLYIAVGIAGALAIPHVNVNMLSPMVSGAYGTGMQYAGTLFAFFIIGLDIPLFCVLTRYNLTHSGLCSVRTANWIVVYIPWALSWIFYQGDSIGILLSWGGVLLTSAVAFILPLYLALRALECPLTNLGSIQVYPGNMSRKNQIRAVKVLLWIACVAVACAIVGQFVGEKSVQKVIHSEEYLNSTETIAIDTANFVDTELRETATSLYHFHHTTTEGVSIPEETVNNENPLVEQQQQQPVVAQQKLP